MHDEVLTPRGMERVFLLPGEFCISEKPVLMATLLGSCVAVCVYNLDRTWAAMNHFLHARALTQSEPLGKSGEASTQYLLKCLWQKDSAASRYEARIFGGSRSGSLGLVGACIGEDNIALARQILKEFKVPIVEEDVGGTQARKIYFNTADSRVTVRKISLRHKDYSDRKIRVLLVDDSPLVLKILTKLIEGSLQVEGCAVAKDAYEARDRLLETDPDVISLDIIMPGLDGLDFLRKIMQYKPTPVVIVSTIAKAGSSIEARARDLGALGVIDKDALGLYKGADNFRDKYLAALRAAAMSIMKGT
ncbi:MAG: response regulator [Candidatus Omnitrophica bacterium]|nr:response regulator [Candidatus Omnitrophota bacterium]